MISPTFNESKASTYEVSGTHPVNCIAVRLFCSSGQSSKTRNRRTDKQRKRRTDVVAGKLKLVQRCFFLLALLFTTTLPAQQTLTLDDAATEIVAGGTSTFHDWEMPLQEGRSSGSATFAFGEDGLAKLTGLKVQIEVEGLKSNKKGMNKDAYAAINTEKFPYITFELMTVNKMEKQEEGYLVDVSGDLSISGVTKTVDLQATCTTDGQQQVTCDGSYSLDMTDYGVNPPKTMLGLVKAGKEVTVDYRAVFVAN